MCIKFEVADMSKNIDEIITLELDNFIECIVNTTDIISSNKFLKSLWREFNLSLSPNKMDKCPWAYIPAKQIGKKTTATYFGSMRTNFGIIHVAITYKKKGTISKIHFYSSDKDLRKPQNSKVMNNLVKLAIENSDVVQMVYIEMEIICFFGTKKVKSKLEHYNGEKFKISAKGKRKLLYFSLDVFDMIDFKNILREKIDLVFNFLSVETNLLFEHRDIITISEESYRQIENEGCDFQNDFNWNNDIENDKFIDDFPIGKDKILLSKESINIIDMILNSNFEENKELNNFIKGCYHFRNALHFERESHGKIFTRGKDFILTKPSGIGNYNIIMDNSIAGYLSAIETVTLNFSTSEKCDECGQVKFAITGRVKKFMDTYFDSGYGDIFKKIYNLRSLYLHTGATSTKNVVGGARPLIDINTGTGAVDTNFITFMIDGKSCGSSIMNLREWTSYSMRNYYKNMIEKTF